MFVQYKHRYLGNAKQISCGKLGQLDFPFGWSSSKRRLICKELILYQLSARPAETEDYLTLIYIQKERYK